jgi:hypothetical protein
LVGCPGKSRIKKLHLSLTDLCWLTGLSKQRIGQLEAAGVVERVGRDKYATISIPRYCKLTREAGQGPEELRNVKFEILTEKLAQARLDRQEREGSMLPADKMMTAICTIINVFKQALLAQPTRIAPQLLRLTNPADAERIVRMALIEVLEELSRMIDTVAKKENAK